MAYSKIPGVFDSTENFEEKRKKPKKAKKKRKRVDNEDRENYFKPRSYKQVAQLWKWG